MEINNNQLAIQGSQPVQPSQPAQQSQPPVAPASNDGQDPVSISSAGAQLSTQRTENQANAASFTARLEVEDDPEEGVTLREEASEAIQQQPQQAVQAQGNLSADRIAALLG